jgi:hypothetical protein
MNYLAIGIPPILGGILYEVKPEIFRRWRCSV